MSTSEFTGTPEFGFPSARDAAFPCLVQIALMHYICNSRCLHCPVGRQRRGVGVSREGEFSPSLRRFFPFQLFGPIAVEMARYPWSILRFHGRGEPLLHPHFVEMIALAKKVGVGTVTSFTNAILLDERRTEQILDARLDVLELSVDASSRELYEYVRGTRNFNRVVRNAENFLRERNRRGSNTRVIVSAVDSPDFQPEKDAFLRFWADRADRVILRPYHTYGGRLPEVNRCAPTEVVPCAQLWTRFSINPWGQANACFNDWADEEIVGDLNQPGASIAGIWSGERFIEIRAAAIAGNSILTCCRTCLATRAGWVRTYQGLLAELRAQPRNETLN